MKKTCTIPSYLTILDNLAVSPIRYNSYLHVHQFEVDCCSWLWEIKRWHLRRRDFETHFHKIHKSIQMINDWCTSVNLQNYHLELIMPENFLSLFWLNNCGWKLWFCGCCLKIIMWLWGRFWFLLCLRHLVLSRKQILYLFHNGKFEVKKIHEQFSMVKQTMIVEYLDVSGFKPTIFEIN